ncbi:MAG: CAP domain-containing protein [Planctomycetota bacterium]|nr:CAP domain-containing protein [Planctomycetota bacterium]
MKWGLLGVVFVGAVVVMVGCGVDSGSRVGKWTQNPFRTPGLPGPGGGGGANPGGDPTKASAAEQEVFKLVNEERKKAGASALSWSDLLRDLARGHSHDMCERKFFDHTNPDGKGPTERGREGKAGRFTFKPCCPDPFSGVGENIAHGYRDAASVMNGWMNSPGHRANILNRNYTHIGVGNCGTDMQGHTGCGTHWTQNFGTARSGGGGGGGGCPPGKG